MSASEALLAATQRAGDYVLDLGPAGLAVNAALSVAVALLGWGVGAALRWALRNGLRRLPGPSTAERKVRTTRALRLSSWLLRALIVAAVVLAIGSIWGLDVIGALTQGLGLTLTQTILRLGLIVLISILAMEAAGFLINHAIEHMADDTADRRRAAQLNTFGPLLRGAAEGTILLIAALMLLGELGVEIGPLLAGAGVLGIAVGFGAQTVVRDLLTGVFLLIEDILAVGDIVRIGDSGGLVEAMTLRTIRLRDFDGTLHVVPYGEAQVVHNLTKRFSYYVFDLPVSYASDIDKALKIMADVGAEMQAEPEYANRILEPIEVVGVDSLGDRGVNLKARIKTMPVEQWSVGREYNRRIKLAFDRAGIEIQFPHLKVLLPEAQIVAEPTGRGFGPETAEGAEPPPRRRAGGRA